MLKSVESLRITYLGPECSSCMYGPISTRSKMALKLGSYTVMIFITAAILFFAVRESPVPAPMAASRAHPFLIVKETDFGELQRLALTSPWKEMKASAIHKATHLAYDATDDYKDKSNRLGEIVNANALAYVLDPANRQTYVRNILDAFNSWDDLSTELHQRSRKWTHEVPPATALFNCILALDIIHNSLSPTDLAMAETKLGSVAECFWTNDEHRLAIWTIRGLWSLYKGEERFDAARDTYRKVLMNYITPDGVFPSGPGYAAARFGQFNTENGTQHFMDVLELTGKDSYYSDSKVRKFYEWLFGYSITPFGRTFIFGDSAPAKSTIPSSPAAYRAYRFSDQAARYAAWNAREKIPKELLITYILMRVPLPEPEKAKSRIFSDGGAWFLENKPSADALAGVLWNAKTIGDNHAHKEVNSLNLCAFGEYLLRNSGYQGWKKGALGFSWDYINNRAVSGNTVLINYSFVDNSNPPLTNDHVSKTGAGISEGFVSPSFDYASGDSGGALPNGRHFRNLVFIHPQDDQNGYWVVFDEVAARKTGDSVHIALHPGSADYSTVSANQEYQWNINRFSGHDVFLTIFQGTSPRNTEIKDGVLAADWGDKSFIGKYLYATYDTDNAAKRNIVTVFFPHDAAHARANVQRVVGSGYSGASLSLSNTVTDVALESSASGTVKYDRVSFEALATLYRLQRGMVTSYFVRRGRAFDDGTARRNGFISDDDISVYVKGSEGKIISPGTKVAFYYPGITGVLLNGRAAPLLEKGNGWVKILVGAGTHDLKFVLAQR